MHKAVRKVLQHVDPTPRCLGLDDDKKALVIVLIGQGASRREAAALVKCHHTTIGRTAARDAKFAAKLDQVESATHLEAGDMIRRAASDPKYWRAAAWMLERRNPEDYAKRDPTTFTGDQVTSLLASLANGARAMLSPEKAAEFELLVDDVLDEIEAKSGAVKREEAGKEPDKMNGRLAKEKPSGNGHHTSNGAAESLPRNGKRHTENGKPGSSANHPHADPLPEGEGDHCESDAEQLEYESFGQEGDMPVDDDSELEPIDDADMPPELLRRREELDAELAAHLGGYATAPPSRAAREVLRDFSRRFVHHPRHQVAAHMAKDALRKALDDNTLHQKTTSCTTAPNTEGRCTNGVMLAGGGSFGMKDEQ